MAGLGESKPHTLPWYRLNQFASLYPEGNRKVNFLDYPKSWKGEKKKVFSNKEVLGGIPFFSAEIYHYCLESSDGEALVD